MPQAFNLLLLLQISDVRLSRCVQRNSSHIGILTARVDWTSLVQDDNYSATLSGGRRSAVSTKASRARDLKQEHNVEWEDISIDTDDDAHIFTPVMYAVCIAITLCIGAAVMWRTSSEPQADAPAGHSETMVLTFLRKSGEQVARVSAEYFWSGKMLREAVSAQLPPGEFLHSILFVSDGCECRVMDFSYIGELGMKNGLEMRVVLVPCLAIPSGIELLSCSTHMVGPAGARNLTRLWLHEDRSANLECGEFIDVGRTNAKYLDGSFDDKGRLLLRDKGQDIETIIGESQGQRHTSLHVPILGNVDLQQELVDAVFDVSQTSDFVGWISLFECAEMVAKVAKKASEGASGETAHLRLQVWRQRLQDGAIKISFQSQNDFESWRGAVAPEVRCSLCCAILCGPVGRRKLTLKDFPVLGSAELIEHPLCSDMTEA